MARPKIVPNATNRIDAREFLRLMQQMGDPKKFPHEAGMFWIVIPSNRGGTLRVAFGRADDEDNELVVVGFNGKQIRHRAGAGKEVRIEFEPGYADEGECTIDVKSPTGRFSLSVMFEEIGYAREANGKPLIPWNFWFFPFANDEPEFTAWAGTSLQPLHKFEQAVGVAGALDWETKEHADPAPDGAKRQHWEGHCNFVAAASIAFQPPPARGKKWRKVAFTCEELKFFAGEFMGRFGEFDLGVDEANTWQLPPDYDSGAPAGRGGELHEKRPKEKPKLFGKYLASLILYLDRAMRKGGNALMMDLRSDDNLKTIEQAREVWNHAVYQYRIVYWQWEGDPGKPITDPFFVQVGVTLNANADELEGPDFACTGLPAAIEKEHGETVVIPEGTGRDLRLRGQLQCRVDGSILVDSSRNRWDRVNPLTAKRDSDEIDHRFELLPPRTALYLAKPAKTESLVKPGLRGNPWLPRSEILQLVRLRRRYR